MKIKPFKFNLKNRIVPQAQSILIGSGHHAPTIFTYNRKGVESIGDLRDLFRDNDKDLIYSVLEQYLKETETYAFVLITEAWMKSIGKDDISSEEHKAILEGRLRIRDIKDKTECITFQWSFKSKDISSGTITYPFKNDNGNIIIDYKSHTEVTNDETQYSRTSSLLRPIEQINK